MLDKSQSVFARDMNLAHMADIKEPDLLTHGQVLIDDALILNRHFPAEEFDHPSAQFLMTGKNAGSLHRKNLESLKYFTIIESDFMQEK
jgi:hypothetical protein